jgi:hypothetical protein
MSSEQTLKESEAATERIKKKRANLSSEQRLKEVEAARVCIRSMHVDMKKEKKDFLVDFSTTKLTEQSHFEAFEQNKEVACMLWHISSGFHRFSQLEDLQGEGGKEAMRSLLDDIHSEKLDPDKINAMIEAFLQAQGRGDFSGYCSPFENSKEINRCSEFKSIRERMLLYLHVLHVGSVILKEETQNTIVCTYKMTWIYFFSLKRIDNDELQLPPLQMPVDDYSNSRTVHIASLRSVCTAKEGRLRGQHYHLYPQFVETDKGNTKALYCKWS